MLKKMDMREVAQAATEEARSATVDDACAAEFKGLVYRGRKRAVVLRLLHGESVDAVSREVGVTIGLPNSSSGVSLPWLVLKTD
ncbi:MAG: hypothetical protein VB137_07225 [Burkholderia sp.]